MSAPVVRHRFTVADYHRMAETGILREDDPVELIEGEILEMTPIGRRHQASVDRLNDLFARGLGDRAIVRVQGSIRLNEYSEPEPDLVLLRRRADFYADQDAGPADVWLVVEVADSSLPYDRDVKAALYARAGIPEFWLVDVNGRSVTVYREPGPDAFSSEFVVQGDDRLSPWAFPEFLLTLGQILG
jgi:Uma2 family endonuclease